MIKHSGIEKKYEFEKIMDLKKEEKKKKETEKEKKKPKKKEKPDLPKTGGRKTGMPTHIAQGTRVIASQGIPGYAVDLYPPFPCDTRGIGSARPI